MAKVPDTAYRFHGMNTLADPASIDCFNVDSPQYGQCVDICNFDLDDEHNAIVRTGRTLVASGSITSGWTSKEGVTYCVKDSYVSTFDGTTVTPLTTAFLVTPTCEFAQVNDVVVFSDNAKIGIIEGNVVTRIDRPSDWIGAADLETWVADHMPANFQAASSNFAVDAFKLGTLAGQCLEFFNGALYLAIDNFVYTTKTFNIEYMDVRYNVVAGFPDAVTMIKHVADGLFVGTTKAVYFLGTSSGSLVVETENAVHASPFKSQKQVAAFGALYGSDVSVGANVVAGGKTSDLAVLWASPMGIFAGTAGGSAVNLSADKVTLPTTLAASVQLKVVNNADPSSFSQYIVSIGSEAWVLNLQTLAHSRYTSFGFESMFQNGTDYYGATSSGIYRLSGADDAGQDIDAFILTPANYFRNRGAKLLKDLYALARYNSALAIDIYVDEVLVCEDLDVPFDNITGTLHTLRAKVPRSLRGVYWQFKIKNTYGAACTLSTLEPVMLLSTGRTR